MIKNNLIFLDTETTGLQVGDRLCQVAYICDGREQEGLFKPPVPITIDAMTVTHITNKMVVNCPPFIGSPMQAELEHIFATDAILVAHNAPFDIEMLRREGLAVKRSIDTFKVAHHMDKEGVIPRYSLQYLRYYHDLDVPQAVAHTALGDVRVLEKIFEFYMKEMQKTLPSEGAVIDEMIAISARPVLLKKFTFGKYIGQEVRVVATEDAGYLTWLLNQKIMARERGEEDDENWIYTLDYYLPKSEGM